MSLVPPQDALFLLGESREHPTHVTALQIFRPPDGAGEEFLSHVLDVLTDDADLKSPFTRRLTRGWSTAGQWTWEPDPDFDITAHVRRTALPPPGRVRELLAHVGAVHARLLDRTRPLWEAELVSGLDDGRFALVTKLHHALFDGITLARHMSGGLCAGPDERGAVAPWTCTRPPARPVPASITDRARGAVDAARRAVGGLPAVAAALNTAVTGASALVFQAPHTRFNSRLSGSRRFAGESWATARLQAVADRLGCRVNDVGLAMCSGALRAYLAERDELPASSLVAMVPISLRGTDPTADPDGGADATSGNSWGSVLCVLGTDLADPAARLIRIQESMSDGKQALRRLDPLHAMVLNVVSLGLAALPALRLVPQTPRPVFNVIVSTVPAAPHTLWFDGAECTDNYPVSMVSDGQALNMTMVPYVDRVAFGLTGCPKAVPHLQSLLGHLDDALTDLERAVGVTPVA